MIKYTNINGKSVTSQQVEMLKEYKIQTFDDTSGKIKKIESVRLKRGNIPFTFFEYYLEPSENKTQIIQQYTDQIKDHRLGIYLNKQSANGFDLWDYESYDNNGNLFVKKKFVYDIQGRMILNLTIDTQTNEITNHSEYFPTKYYYGTALDTANGLPNLELEFRFKFDTDINQFVTYIKDINGTTGEIHTMNVNEFIELFGQAFWDSHPYYHSVLPFLPTSANI